jgi:hypothetical protein
MTSYYEKMYSKFEAKLLQDADDAITKCGLWGWMAEFNPAAGVGFMFTRDDHLDRIHAEMKMYDDHSGASYGWTMRVMQKVARLGKDKFATVVATENPPCPCRKAAGYWSGWCGNAGGGVPACDH